MDDRDRDAFKQGLRMGVVAYLLLLVFGFVLVLLAHCDEMVSAQPEWEVTTATGCRVQRVNGKGVLPGWQLIVWADYANRDKPKDAAHHWSRYLSFHNDRRRALRACDDWLEQADRAIEAARESK